MPGLWKSRGGRGPVERLGFDGDSGRLGPENGHMSRERGAVCAFDLWLLWAVLPPARLFGLPRRSPPKPPPVPNGRINSRFTRPPDQQRGTRLSQPHSHLCPEQSEAGAAVLISPGTDKASARWLPRDGRSGGPRRPLAVAQPRLPGVSFHLHSLLSSLPYFIPSAELRSSSRFIL